MTETGKAYQIYYKNLMRSRVFSSKVIKLYVKSYKRHDHKDALEKIIESNQRYIRFIAKKALTAKFDILDLINEGNIGLIEAIDKFDYNRRSSFLSFAHYQIRKRILLYKNTYGTKVHTPYDVVIGSNAVKRFIEDYTKEHSYEPSKDIIKRRLNINDTLLNKELNYINNFNNNIYIEHDIANSNDDNNKDLKELMLLLPEDKRQLLNELYGSFGTFPKDIKIIAEERHTTAEAVSEEVDKILKLLKQIK